jgi:two-component system cell cycle sensor histidine kinase/response regulator CckA
MFGRSESSLSEQVQARSRSSARLLLAEDDPTLRSLVATMLEREGYETLQAADGEEALRVAMQHLESLDLLLTDDRMPGMNGYELTRFLRSVRPDLKVIVMSGSADIPPPVPDAAILLKPFTLEELARLVASRLRGTAGRRALRGREV